MARHNAITPKKKKVFLEGISKGLSISMACRRAGFTRSGEWKQRQKKKWAKDFEEAYENGTDVLEDEAHRRAVDGWDEPKFWQGDEIGVVRKFSDRLLEMLLKARKPEKYRERSDVNVTGDMTVKVVKFADGNKNSK